MVYKPFSVTEHVAAQAKNVISLLLSVSQNLSLKALLGMTWGKTWDQQS